MELKTIVFYLIIYTISIKKISFPLQRENIPRRPVGPHSGPGFGFKNKTIVEETPLSSILDYHGKVIVSNLWMKKRTGYLFILEKFLSTEYKWIFIRR